MPAFRAPSSAKGVIIVHLHRYKPFFFQFRIDRHKWTLWAKYLCPYSNTSLRPEIVNQYVLDVVISSGIGVIHPD